MKEDLPVTGLILAGGRSRRFGADKALHRVAGRSMIEHAYRVVSTVCETVLVSIGQDSSSYDLPNVHFVRDRYSSAGPLAGIHAGLSASETEWVLVIACDMPFLQPKDLRALLAGRSARSRAVVAKDGAGRLHPACACYRRDTLPLLEEQLHSGRFALHAFLERLDDIESVVLQDRALRNINTRVDLTSR